MPKSWYIQSENRINPEEDSDEEVNRKKLYQAICAEKKPYFFIYNYPSLKKEYDSYMANVENKSQSLFIKTFAELRNKKSQTEDESKFIKWANDKNPIDMSPSVMNKICWEIEKEFDTLAVTPHEKFDYSMLKSGRYYSSSCYHEIFELYKWYKRKMSDFGKKHNSEFYMDEDDLNSKEQVVDYFAERCAEICPNRFELCDILIDICYSGRTDKEVVWIVCGDTIIDNLLKKNNNNLYYPKRVDDGGEFECCGHKFAMTKLKILGGDEE